MLREFFFFFSSRRRHTRSYGDWSSDVCSSDLGTYAKLGKFIDEGFRLKVEMLGGKLGGRAIEYVQVDDESEPAKGTDNMNRLVGREKVDVVVGTVHSGVAMAMAKVA